MVWQRDKNVNYPKIWVNYYCAKSNQDFVVKDLTSDYYDIALGYMTNMFMEESAICKPLGILYDPIARKQLQDKWLNIMKANMAIICVCMSKRDVPRVAGIHLTLVRVRQPNLGSKVNPSTLNQFNKFSRVVEDLKNEGELFDRFGSDFYLGSLGLFVLPEFRGLGIATQMLKARLLMCQELSLPGTATVFSTAGAQAAASKAGYQTIAVKTPADCDYFHLDSNLAVMGVKI